MQSPLTAALDIEYPIVQALATEEANVHEIDRERVTDAAETETAYSTVFSEGWPGVPHRVLENETPLCLTRLRRRRHRERSPQLR